MKDWVVNLIKEVAFFAINGLRKLQYIICLLFPIKDNRVFVNCFDGKGFGDNPKYIVQEIFKMKSDIECCWVYNGKEKNEKLIYCRPFSIKAIFLQATSSVWISTVRMPYYSIKRKNQVYYQTWHGGLAFKKIEHECEDALSPRYIRTAKKDSKMIDYYISDNEDNTRMFKEHFWYVDGEILKIGSPRNDIFFKKNQNSGKIRKKLHIPDKKIIVYAPTFRKSESFKQYNINFKRLIHALKNRFGGEWAVVVRLHPRLENLAPKYIKYEKDIINGSSIPDIQELLSIADVLITDYSSIAFDFLNTNRPVFIYAKDIEEYKRDRDFHLQLESTPFDIATNNDELSNFILGYDDLNYQDKVQKFKSQFGFYGKGNAGKIIADMICRREN